MNIRRLICIVFCACFFESSQSAKLKRYKLVNKVQRSFVGNSDNNNKKFGWLPSISRRYSQQEQQVGGLWPTVFNVAAKAIISSNATCGESGREVFCRFSGSSSRSKCGYCDNASVDPGKRHPIRHAIEDGGSWWQSPALFYGPQYEYVTITLNLKQLYQISYVILKAANAPRPACWILEKSLDGKVFVPWQYFATSDRECHERYGIPSMDFGNGKGNTDRHSERYITDTDVVCTTAFSRSTPMENGEIHVSLVNGRPGANETSPELLEFTKALYVRFRFQAIRGKTIGYGFQHQNQLQRKHSQLSTPGGLPSITSATNDDYEERSKRLYYAIKDINIGGQCVCNGHASSCRHNVQSERLECECVHHTCGHHCDTCCPLFNQKPWGAASARDARVCSACNCHAHASACHYDEDVDRNGLSMNIHGHYLGGGVCDNCTDFTAGINCDKCLPGYYRPYNLRPDDSEPCFPCDCDPIGSVGPCHVVNKSLICECKPGYAGHRCDVCSEGFRDYPNCEPCSCDNRGVIEDDCESACVCKTNVIGKFCDQCKPGYFGLNQENPDGCSKCFCSGVTSLCQSALLVPSYIDTLDNWLLTTIALSQYEIPFVDDANHLLTVGGGQLDTINGDTYYWFAPPAYLGKALRSYGAAIEAKVHWSVMRGDTSGRLIRIPDAILIGGVDEITIAWGDNTYEGSNVTLNIPLMPNLNSWYHLPSGLTNFSTPLSSHRRPETILATSQYRAVSRAEFLTVLANLKAILIRAHFHTDQIEGSLERVRMGVGEWMDADEKGNETYTQVEQCSCPSGYTGLSCELCEYGYVRIPNIDTSVAIMEDGTAASYRQMQAPHFCARCDCNGHSATCDMDTGRCSCEHNTVGDRCNRCVPGYYGNPLSGTPDDCQRCACPLLNDENNFSTSCQADDKHSGYVCTQCPRGYTGDHCEICDDGHYGEPHVVGGSCQPCTCGGGPCDRKAGQCLGCKGNTDGWRCERCKPGHFGDPSTQNCEACLCDPVGALSSDCDNVTGQCQCKPFFIGTTCSTCQEGYGNVTAHCILCQCDLIGSISDICDKQSGICTCQPGVEGFHCDTCQHLHFGFSENGCRRCNCSLKGSQIRSCEPDTGQCRCKSHFTGLNCDSCEAGYYETAHDCAPCQCSVTGALGDICDVNGQCFCHANVTGRQCDRCKDGHYGYSAKGCKECDLCNLPGHICDKKSGRCICPPNTYGIKCEKCQELHHWENKDDKSLGCSPCTCDYYGSLSMQCDIETALCTCHVGYSDAQCQDCALGYYRPAGHNLCKRCSCSAPGTDPYHGNCTENAVWEDDGSARVGNGGGEQWCACDRLTGKCPCKNNVLGDYCDICKEGTFGLSIDNPDGCTECFCFGRSSNCEASVLTWGQIRSAPRILTYEPQQNILVAPKAMYKPYLEFPQEIPGTSGDIPLNNFDLQLPIYWRLPVNFERDLVLSYGGYFKFRIGTIIFNASDTNSSATGSQTNERLNTRHIEAPLIIIDGNGLRLKYYHARYKYQISGLKRYGIKLDGSQWQMDDQSIGASLGVRERLMLALQNVTAIWIRSTESDVFNKLTLSDVTLDSALHLLDEPLPHAISVEICDCPLQYNGTSCQNPSKGYYRQRFSSQQDKFDVGVNVGVAVNCECNNRSDWCDIESGKCENCRNNTSGSRCENCAEGYYGFPMQANGTCIACNCPEPNRNFATSCTQNPVVCKCKEGYEGPTCEKCSKGYYGQPHLSGNSCKPCICNIGGSLSVKCDAFGQCTCKKNMTGLKCDQCKANRHVIDGSVCTPCNDCVQNLLDGIESFSYQIFNLTNITIGPPWGILAQLEEKFLNITAKFGNYANFHEKSNEIFNRDFTDNYSSDLKALMDLVKDMRYKYAQNIKQTAELASTTDNFLDKLDQMEDSLVELIESYKTVSTTQISTQEAVKRAESVLKDIENLYLNMTETSRAKNILNKCQDINIVLNELSNSREYDPKNISNNVKDFEGRLIDLDETIAAQRESIFTSEKINIANADRLQQLQLKIDEVNHRQDINRDNLKKIKMDFKESKELLQKMSLNDDGFEELKQLIPKLQNALDRIDEFDKIEITVQKHANKIVQQVTDNKGLFHLDSEELLAVEVSNRYSEIVKNLDQASTISSAAETLLEKILHVPSGNDSIYANSSIALADSTRLEKRLENIKDNMRLHIESGVSTLYPRLDDMRMRLWAQGVANINDTRRIGAVHAALEKVISQIQDVERNVTKSSKTAHEVYKRARYIITDNEHNLQRQYAKLLNLTATDKINDLRHQIRKATELLRSDLINMNIIRNFKYHRDIMKPSINLNEELGRLKYSISSAMKKLSSIKVPILGAACTRFYRISDHEPSMVSTISLSIDLPRAPFKSGPSTILFYVAADDNRQYIQIELQPNRQLLCKVRLGHQFEEIQGDEILDEGYWTINFERDYNFVNLTVIKGAISKPPKENRLIESQIFDVHSDNYVILGGNGSITTGLPGCLHSAVYNGRDIGLWTFINSTNCNACKRTVSVAMDKMMFNGNGYSYFRDEIASERFTPDEIRISISMSTFDENALLFLIAPSLDVLKGNNDTTLFLAGYLKDGYVNIELNYGWMKPLILKTDDKYNTGNPVDLDITKLFKKGVDTLSLSLESLTGTRNLKFKHILRTRKCQLFFGGVSERFRTLYATVIVNKLKINNGLLGSLHATIYGYNGIFNKEQFEFTGLEEYHGDLKFTNALFDASGHLILSTNLTTSLDFVLRTDQKDTAIVRIGEEKATITLENNNIKLKYIAPVLNHKSTADSVNPYIPHTSNLVSLRIDDNPERTDNSADSILVLSVNGKEVDREFMSGTVNGMLNFGLNSLNGTVRDVRVDNKLVHFSTGTVSEFKDVKIGRSRAFKRKEKDVKISMSSLIPVPSTTNQSSDQPLKSVYTSTTARAMMDEQQLPTVISVPYTLEEDIFQVKSPNIVPNCSTHAPMFEQNAAGFGLSGATGSYVYHRLKDKFWQEQYEMHFEFRTFERDAMLLLAMALRKNGNTRRHHSPHSNILVLRDGFLYYKVSGKRTKSFPIPSLASLADGKWHSVKLRTNFIAGTKKRSLTVNVDGHEDVKGGKLPTNRVGGFLYIGGIGGEGHGGTAIGDLIPMKQFRGCIRNFEINHNVFNFVNSKFTELHQIGQCFPHIEYGSYFNGDAYAKYRYKLPINTKLTTSLSYRTISPTYPANSVLLTASLLSHDMESTPLFFTLNLMGTGLIVASLGETNVTFDLHYNNYLYRHYDSYTREQNDRNGRKNHDFGGCLIGEGEWHHVIAGFGTDVLQLIVDGVRKDWVLPKYQQELLRGYAQVRSSTDEENDDGVIYIGGVPSSFQAKLLTNHENFKGCMREIRIMDETIDWLEMEHLNNVVLNSCPKLN